MAPPCRPSQRAARWRGEIPVVFAQPERGWSDMSRKSITQEVLMSKNVVSALAMSVALAVVAPAALAVADHGERQIAEKKDETNIKFKYPRGINCHQCIC